VGWQPEELTAQVDGVTTLFTTTFARDPGRLVVFLNGAALDGAQVTEPNQSQFQLASAPVVPNKLIAVYHTDQTVDGRILGFPEDPTGGGPTLPPDLVNLLDSFDGRLDALEANVVGTPKLQLVVPTNGQTVFVLDLEPILTSPIILSSRGIGFTREGGHITVGGVDNKTVTWIETGFSFVTSERVELLYFTLG